DDVPMLAHELEGPRLAPEALDEVGLLGQELLQREALARAGGADLVDDAHASPAEDADELVRTEALGEQARQVSRRPSRGAGGCPPSTRASRPRRSSSPARRPCRPCPSRGAPWRRRGTRAAGRRAGRRRAGSRPTPPPSPEERPSSPT